RENPRTKASRQRILSPGPAFSVAKTLRLVAVARRHQLELEQSAVQGAVVQGVAPPGLQPHPAGQVEVAGDDVELPAAVVALQPACPFGPEVAVLVRQPLAVGRVGDDPARWRWRWHLARIADLEADRVGAQVGAFGIGARRLDGVRLD